MKFCPTCNKTYTEGQTFCPSDGEVLQESPESFVGRVIDGKYRVEGFIAQGGMGSVYRARHILLGDVVVIKTLRSEMRHNAEWLKRFQREGKAARAFRHPNSVTVYDLSTGSDGMIYMVMEYVEGRTLEEELKRRGRFTPAEALEVLEPVAAALDAAHARGVVHRDLKPENIMLGPDGRGDTVVKVLDLGIAKLTGAADVHSARVATSLTMAGQILGTPYYMSPEQWGETPRDGDPEVDGRADIYSLGVICFELVAGRKPLGGGTLSELRRKHLASAPPSLSDAAPGVPAEFDRAVARAMAKDRADRPQTAGDFVAELRDALGLSPRAHARGPRENASGSVATPDAARRGVAGVAATAHLAPGPASDFADVSRDDTLLTDELDSPAPEFATGARPRRDTVASEPAGAQREGAAVSIRAGEDARAVRHTTARSEADGAGVSVAAPEPRRTLAPLVMGGALALLVVAGVGGWLAWRGRDARPASSPPAAETSRPAAPPAAHRVEAASYWFETFERREDASGKRVAEAAPELASGAWFKFHFVTRQRGYLYIIGPYKDGNAQVTMLTAKGAGELRSNLVGPGADFSFPFGVTKLRLDENAGADEFTFIFSPTPLMSPAFLADKHLRELTPEDVKALEDFRAQFKSDAPEAQVRGDGPDRRVAVLAPEAAADGGRPLIFDVRVNHR